MPFTSADDEAIINLNREQVPNKDSTVTVDPLHTDTVVNQPVVHLDWRLREEDKRTAVRALEICKDYLEQRGAVESELLTDLKGGAHDWPLVPHEGALYTGGHHMGALRISASEDDGIVNPDARMHSVDYLYIAGCRIFPTGGYANPTLTIMAMALRLADHLTTLKS